MKDYIFIPLSIKYIIYSDWNASNNSSRHSETSAFCDSTIQAETIYFSSKHLKSLLFTAPLFISWSYPVGVVYDVGGVVGVVYGVGGVLRVVYGKIGVVAVVYDVGGVVEVVYGVGGVLRVDKLK